MFDYYNIINSLMGKQYQLFSSSKNYIIVDNKISNYLNSPTFNRNFFDTHYIVVSKDIILNEFDLETAISVFNYYIASNNEYLKQTNDYLINTNVHSNKKNKFYSYNTISDYINIVDDIIKESNLQKKEKYILDYFNILNGLFFDNPAIVKEILNKYYEYLIFEPNKIDTITDKFCDFIINHINESIYINNFQILFKIKNEINNQNIYKKFETCLLNYFSQDNDSETLKKCYIKTINKLDLISNYKTNNFNHIILNKHFKNFTFLNENDLLTIIIPENELEYFKLYDKIIKSVDFNDKNYTSLIDELFNSYLELKLLNNLNNENNHSSKKNKI